MPIDLLRSAGWLVLGWLVSIALFRGLPGVDLFVTGLFWREGGGFALTGNAGWEWLRQRLWDMALGMVLLSALAAWWTHRKVRPLAGLTRWGWGGIFALFLLGPGLVVNGWLKAFSGRARPAHVTEFGGDKLFTPAGQFTDQCAANCSFVSGEVSAATALALALWLIALALPIGWAPLRRGLRFGLQALALAIPVFVIAQRVATGRHFASDAVFAVLITLSLGWGLIAVLGRKALAQKP